MDIFVVFEHMDFEGPGKYRAYSTLELAKADFDSVNLSKTDDDDCYLDKWTLDTNEQVTIHHKTRGHKKDVILQ